jgi:protoheme ferro-lyase
MVPFSHELAYTSPYMYDVTEQKEAFGHAKKRVKYDFDYRNAPPEITRCVEQLLQKAAQTVLLPNTYKFVTATY